MHSLSRCAIRCWTMTSTATCQAAFSTCRLSKSDTERNSLPYQSVGWVLPDLREVRHEPWMQWWRRRNVRKPTPEDDQKWKRTRKRHVSESPRRDVEQSSGSRKAELVSHSSSSRGQGKKRPGREPAKKPAKPAKPNVTAISGAITMAKSSSGLWRNIGRNLLPELPKGLPPPPAKLDYQRRPYRFVPIRPRELLEPHPSSIPGNDYNLEEYFDESSKRELAMPYIDTDEYALAPKAKRIPSNVSGMPIEEWKRSEAEMLRPTRDDGLEVGDHDDDGLDNRPDYIAIDPSRLPRVGAMSRLPTAAEITVEQLEDDPNRPRQSGRLWRSSPIILPTALRNQGRSGT